MQKILALLFIVISITIIPLTSYAALSDIIPCGKGEFTVSDLNPSGAGTVNSNTSYDECDFYDFVQLIKNVINILFIISIPLATVAFTWVGVLLLTAGGNQAKITEAKGIALKVLIGFLFIVGAWILIYSITSIILKDSYNEFLK